MKILTIVESAFRTLVEELDDTILWLNQTVKKAGADISIILSGNASQYAFMKKTAPAITIGDWKQKSPANIPDDIQRILDSGVSVYVYSDDIAQRGLKLNTMFPGVKLLSRYQALHLYNQADQIWQW